MGSSPIYRTIKKLFASAKSFFHEAPCGHEGMKRPSAMKYPSGMEYFSGSLLHAEQSSALHFAQSAILHFAPRAMLHLHQAPCGHGMPCRRSRKPFQINLICIKSYGIIE